MVHNIYIVCFQCVEITYASEKTIDDPVKVTYFYNKEEPWKAIRGDNVSYIIQIVV